MTSIVAFFAKTAFCGAKNRGAVLLERHVFDALAFGFSQRFPIGKILP